MTDTQQTEALRLAEIIGIIDPWPLGDQKGKA